MHAQQKSNYEKEWKAISDLEKKGLTRSAYQQTEKLFQKAQDSENDPQIIKAANYLMKYNHSLKVDSDTKNFYFLDSLIQETVSPAKNILQSMQAELLANYQENNTYKLLNRTALAVEDNADIETWSLEKFHRTIIGLYKKSLADKGILQKTNIQQFGEILNKGKNTEGLRPTVYDVLAHRALDYFENSNNNITSPADKFIINDAVYFSNAETFALIRITGSDTLSPYMQALSLYQDILQFHIQDKYAAALMDADLRRLAFVYRHAVVENKFELYERALLHVTENIQTESQRGESYYLLAQLYAERGRQHSHTDSLYKNDFIKAKEYAQKAVQLFPSSIAAKKAKNVITEIERPSFQISREEVVIPNQPFKSLIQYSNIENLYFKIIKTTRAQLKAWDETRWKDRNASWNTLNKQQILTSGAIQLPQTHDYREHSVEVKTDALPQGVYLILTSMNKDFDTHSNLLSIQTLYVSEISYLQNNKNEIFVLNRSTGEPLAGAELRLWDLKYDYGERKNKEVEAGKYTTNKNGYAKFATSKQRYNKRIQVKYKGDELFTDDYSYNYYDNYRETEANRIFFFLDRSLYRPGQTVYFKGIAIHQDSTRRKSTVITRYKSVIQLKDANGQSLQSIPVTSNEFGSFEGSFIIPEGLMNGSFYLLDSTTQSVAYFQVEEYKRPKFFIGVEKPTGTYKVNDSITVTGNATAYAGNVINGATVTYRVVRKVQYPIWWGWGRSFWPPQGTTEQMEIANGQVITDEKGAFQISFKAIPDETVDKKNQPRFHYEVSVDVTDLNGETRSGLSTVTVSYQAIQLDIIAPEKMAVDSFATLKIKSSNTNDVFEKTKVHFEVYRLNAPDKLFKKRYWEQPDQFIMTKAEHDALFPNDVYANEDQMSSWALGEKIYDFSDSTQADHSFSVTKKNIPAGWYKIIVSSKDKYGEPVRAEKYIQILSANGTGSHTPLTLVSNKPVFEPGDQLLYSVHTGFDKIWWVNSLERSTGKTDQQVSLIQSSNPARNKINITEKDRGGMVLNYFFVKNNRMYSGTEYYSVPWKNKELEIRYETFRDKLLPGATEEWKVNISGSKKDKIAAEILVSMYDASLDQFKMHQWNNLQSIWPTLYASNHWRSDNFESIQSYAESFLQESYVSVPKKIYDILENYGLYYRRYMMMAQTRAVQDSEKREAAAPAPESDDKARNEYTVADSAAATPRAKDAENSAQPGGSENIRSNFNETAFFFPQLKTDSAGNISFSFTIPEALTTWKLMTLAHTKDLASAYSEKTVITQKPLMVQPNPPRFLREGDQMEFSTKVVNMTDKEMIGTAHLELFDATNDKPINGLFNNVFDNQYFTVPAHQSVALSFPINVPHNFGSALKYQIKAISKDGLFTDGESSVLPVLSNRMLVTESFPINMRNETEKTFQFKELLRSENSGTLTHHAITVEYSSNPAWYAIQALPYLMEYPYDCAEQTFNRYYANALAAHVLQSSPKIKAVFDRWKLEDSAALLSNLQKNEELKSALLQETPWVLQAKDESQQKRNIALLFELSKLSASQTKTLNKLKEMQSSNGGFTWFKGGPDDRYMTQYIVSGIGHLKKLSVINEKEYGDLKPIVDKAISYLDNRIKEDYDNLIKYKVDLKKNQLSRYAIQYLYMRSFFNDYKIAAKNKVAYDFYREQSEKFWLTQSKYLQGMIALSAHRNQNHTVAKSIIRSLKENAIYHKEMGMYWKSFTQGGYFWHEAPIESQALMIEAFSEIANDVLAVDDMKTWLLKQKQTQNWHSTKATAEAVYALLLNGSNWLAEEKTVQIRLGNKTISSAQQKTEAGTGYFKETLIGNEVEAAMGNIQVQVQSNTENSNSSSWGAVYWQYFEELDKIGTSKTGLHLEKQLFVQKNSNTGPVLEALSDGNTLQIGDRVVVRIILRVDRDMEYVHMKDMRASGMEPVNVISSYKWQGGLGYYESTKDASTQFFFSRLPKGTYSFEYPVFVTHAGNFSNGITQIQCMYAPEFSSHSEGIRLVVKE